MLELYFYRAICECCCDFNLEPRLAVDAPPADRGLGFVTDDNNRKVPICDISKETMPPKKPLKSGRETATSGDSATPLPTAALETAKCTAVPDAEEEKHPSGSDAKVRVVDKEYDYFGKRWNYWDPDCLNRVYEDLSLLMRSNIFPGYNYNYNRGSTNRAHYNPTVQERRPECGIPDNYRKCADELSEYNFRTVCSSCLTCFRGLYCCDAVEECYINF